MEGTCPRTIERDRKAVYQSFPLYPSRGDHAASNIPFALETAFRREDREIEDYMVDILKAIRHNSTEWASLPSQYVS